MAAPATRRLLYVASPGIRNYVEYGGVGFLVYDVDNGHTWVKRIPTWDVPEGEEPENVKGVAASAETGRIYLTTPWRTACFDLISEAMVWDREYEGGCDRMALSPDGSLLYVPSFEKGHWHVVDATTGDVIERIEVGRPLLKLDPPLHPQRQPDARLRQRQRAAGLRDRRFEDRRDALPRRSRGLRARSGRPARLSQPRHRAHAGRVRDLGFRWT